MLSLACAAPDAASPATVDDLVAALHAGDDARARELLDALEGGGLAGDHDVRFLRGVLHLRAGEGAEAARVFAELEALEGPAPRLATGQALSAWAAGRPEEARARLEEAARLWPEALDVWANLGDVYRALAARAYQRVRALRGGAGASEPYPALSLFPRPPAPEPAPVAPPSVAPSAATPLRDEAAPASAVPLAAPAPAAPASAAPVPAAPMPSPAASGECFRAGPWSGTPPSAVMAWLREHGARILSFSSPPPASHYRVYLGPFGDRAEAMRTIADLERLGLRDMARISSGPLRDAVSLGVYREMENADRRLRALRAMGIEPEMQAAGQQVWLHGSAPDLRALTAVWSGAFPHAPLSSEPCRPRS